MTHLAPQHWPEGSRTGYCYGYINLYSIIIIIDIDNYRFQTFGYSADSRSRDPSSKDCDMKQGNPFGPFWDEIGVEFDESQFTALGYDVHNLHTRNKWITK